MFPNPGGPVWLSFPFITGIKSSANKLADYKCLMGEIKKIFDFVVVKIRLTSILLQYFFDNIADFMFGDD